VQVAARGGNELPTGQARATSADEQARVSGGIDLAPLGRVALGWPGEKVRPLRSPVCV